MKKPVNLTLHERVLEFASQIMALRGHGSLSAFVEELIRDEYERRHGTLTVESLKDAPPSPPGRTGAAAAEAVAKHEAGKIVYRRPSKRAHA